MLNTKKDRISLKNIIPVMNKHCNSLVMLFVKMKCRFFPPYTQEVVWIPFYLKKGFVLWIDEMEKKIEGKIQPSEH